VRSPRLLAAVLAAIVAALAACSGPTEPPSVSERTLQAIEGNETFAWDRQEQELDLGVTHTQDSLGSHEPDEARERGIRILADGGIWQNHHLMGFGTSNPEPAPGEYDWETLDRRMELTEQTGARTVLTACCAPDWMKGGDAGETDWTRLEDDPEPEHFGDYANLVAAAVERYPQIERVLVWNELKGFYHREDNRWDYEGYTDLYNQIYTAVKAVRSDVQVGGPYVVLTSLDPGSTDASDVGGAWGVADQRALDVIDYWLDNNVGAEFLAVDASTSTRQDTTPDTVTDGAQKYADLDAWLRERTTLPIWWAEFYPDPPAGEEAGPESSASAVATLAAVAAYADSNASAALLWGPQGHGIDYSALWTDSTQEDGGEPTPLTGAWQWLVPRLAAGEVEIGRSPTMPLLVFRADDGAVVVNLTGDAVQVTPDTEPVAGWAVTVTDRSS
jgi:Beta-galactosidase